MIKHDSTALSPDALIFRIFPHPLVSVIVGLAWLMLQHSVALGHVLLAALWAWLIPLCTQNFIIRTPHIQWWLALQLILRVLWDIICSNIRVARLILGSPDRLQPAWFRLPLDTNHPQVNSLLAMIITTTPGTVSAGIDDERGDILVHSLHSTVSHDIEIQKIKQRYEQPLIQIFSAPLAYDWIPADELPPPDAPLELSEEKS